MGSPHRENAPLPGQALAESNFRPQFEAIVIGIINVDTETMRFSPAPSERIGGGDILIVLGKAAVIDALREKVCTPQEGHSALDSATACRAQETDGWGYG